VERLQRHGQAGVRLWGHVVVQRGAEGKSLTGDVCLFDATGAMVAEVQGLRLKHVACEELLRAAGTNVDDWLYEIEWQRRALRDDSARTTPSDYIPPPAQIAARVEPLARQLIAHPDIQKYDEFLPEFDKLCAAYIVAVLRQLGWNIRLQERVSVVSLSAQLGVVEQHSRLLGRFLEILQEEGVLQWVGSDWQVCRVPEPIDPQGLWQGLMERFPRDEAALTLVSRSGRHLADALRGKYDPLQLLFPGGSFDVADKLYQESPGAVAHNTMAQEVISAVVEHLPEKRIIRVLEIGAGSGGMTAFVLAKLPAERTEYAFTDISPFFTSKAQQRFRSYPFISYQLLNIEQDPEGQGFDRHRFDVIFAASVLHATADLRQSLEHVKRLLAPGGVLMLSEGTRPQRWIDLTFGLTEGWWRFTDRDLRPSYPLLPRDKWMQLLAELGFTGAVTIPDESASGALADQALILAQAPSPDASALTAEESQAEGSWLIFADRGGVGHQLAQLFAAQGQPPILVTPGTSYAALEQDQFKIEPTCPEDYLRLVRETLGNERLAYRGVIHLWGLDVLPADEITTSQLAMAQSRGCRSVLYLVQALATARASRAAKLWLVTRGAQPVGSEPAPLAVEQAPLWGMGKVIALEHPELHCARVDLSPAGGDDEVQALFDEIAWGDCEDQVGYRGSVRHVARLVRSRTGRSQMMTGANPASTTFQPQTEAIGVQSEATYLITGGLGGIGLLMAEWLVSRGARHLALMGRRGASDAVRETLRELEQAGTQVTVIQADVSQAEQMAQAFEKIERTLPPLRGVIHSAGVLADGVLLQQDWDRFTEVMAPKIAGAWHLHALTRDKSLDFFVLFSSLASLLGSAGQSNHAAANAFMDALAFHRRAMGLPALSINWGIWSEIGAAARQNVGDRFLEHGMRTFSPQEGLTVFERVLRRGLTQVGVMPINWPRFIRQFTTSDGEQPFFAELAIEARQRGQSTPPADPELDTLKRLEQAPPNQRHKLLLEYIRSQALKVLGLEASEVVDARQPLADLGLDSLMAVELRNLLGRGLRLRRNMPATLLYDFPTISELANYIAKDVLQWEDIETLQSPDQEAGMSGVIDRIEDLSEEEVDRLFAEKMMSN
jgi:NAD(P)-dependent dehydrogenase (short-subunit alcohol dehydrogenase family)/SAM-dependent methyltransferase/acyl carrier protein